jgi:hypothetical protein
MRIGRAHIGVVIHMRDLMRKKTKSNEKQETGGFGWKMEERDFIVWCMHEKGGVYGDDGWVEREIRHVTQKH